MANETPAVRAHVFIDGQNLAFAAKNAFDCPMANYDILALAVAACELRGWQASNISFYTGLPCKAFSPKLHRYWTEKLTVMRAQGVNTISLPLKYVTTCTRRADGTVATHHQAQEKGIDVRIAVDIIGAAHDQDCDAIVLFSQDNDLREALLGAQKVVARTHRTIQLACAFPISDRVASVHGIKGIPPIPISREIYERCIDKIDYTHDSKAPSRKTQIDRASRAKSELDSFSKNQSLAPA
jgi:uncharacterized LabA/DUF88 family protein